jgi:hypothetical protein
MGKDLNVDPTFIMALALQESGWGLSHVFETNSSSGGLPLNNLFGLTYAGGDNIRYNTVADSAIAWEDNWGKYLQNHPTTIQEFVNDLTSDPNHMYNASPNWKVSITGGSYRNPFPRGVGNTPVKTTPGTYHSLLKAMSLCDIHF